MMRGSAVFALGLVCSLVSSGCSSGGPEAENPPTSPVASEVASPTPTPTGPQTIAEAVDATGSGVYRIETTRCGRSTPSSGSGFRVGEDLVATVAHVLQDVRTISVRTPEGVVRGEVVGFDAEREVALVRAVKPITGHVFEFGTESPEVTSEVAGLGYPLGLQMAPAMGHVTGLDRRIEWDDRSMTGLIQTDALIHPGDSGGPLIDEHGTVAGLVEAQRMQVTRWGDSVAAPGIAFAVPAGVAVDLIEAWSSEPVVQSLADCPDPAGALVTTESIHSDAPAIALTFATLVEGINERDYEQAWYALTGDMRKSYGGYEQFVRQYDTSRISDFVLEKASRRDETRNTADVRFTSTQDAASDPHGQSCSQWHVRYSLRVDSGKWLIDGTEDLGESPADCSSVASPTQGDAVPAETATPQGSATPSP